MADWTSLLASSPAAPGNSVQTGMYAGIDAAQKAHEALYAQQLKQTAEALVSHSIDDAGNFDPDKYMKLSAQTPFGATAMVQGLKLVSSQWDAAQAGARAGNQMNAMGVDPTQVFPGTPHWRDQPVNGPVQGAPGAVRPEVPAQGANWRNQPVKAPVSQSSSLAPAVPGKDTTGFTTPDMEAPASGYSVQKSTVEGQGQSASDAGLTANPTSLDYGTGAPGSGEKAYTDNLPHSTLYNIQHENAGAGLQKTPEIKPPAAPDLTKMDKDTQAGIANDLRTGGQYTGNDVAGPNMQKAFEAKNAALWEKHLATEPRPNQFITKDGDLDMGGFQKAHAAWAGEGANWSNTVADNIRNSYATKMNQATQKLGQVSTGQGITQTANVIDQVDDAHKAGFKNVTSSNLADFSNIKGQVDWLANNKASVDEMWTDLAKGKTIPNDKFNSLLVPVINSAEVADQINTESGRAKLENILRSDQSLGSLVRQYDGRPAKELLLGVAASKATSNTQQETLGYIKDILDSQLKGGASVAKLNQYKGYSNNDRSAPVKGAHKVGDTWTNSAGDKVKMIAPGTVVHVNG